MNEKEIPTWVLLEQLKSPVRKISSDAFNILVNRFSAPFLYYAISKLLSDADGASAKNDTFLKMDKFRGRYERLRCACEQECDCAERAAVSYLWTMHEHTIIDWQRKTMVAEQLEELDEMWPAPENSNISPEAYIERIVIVEAILWAWNSLSDVDRQLLVYRPGPGPRNEAREQAIQEARCEVWARFRAIVKAALAEEDQ